MIIKSTIFLISICNTFLIVKAYGGYISSESWATFHADRLSSPKCVDIPSNFTLCKNMQYNQMRFPNFFEHETLAEVLEQSESFVPLANIDCHPDTKMFLCSLFAPVCLSALDKHIPPCRSLCLAVRQGCEGRMKKYGFEWPEMLNCNNYPIDNDMCIKALAPNKPSTVIPKTTPKPTSQCRSCGQISTFENIIDNYCRANIVIKGKLHKVDRNHVAINKGGMRNLKHDDMKRHIPKNRLIRLNDQNENGACSCKIEKGNHLIMASQLQDGTFVAKLIIPWKRDDIEFKKTIRSMKKLNCQSLGREIRQSVFRRPHTRQHLSQH
uniref:Secreted frizzled-related protein 1 n=1 Tax=Parastrongyloides trichosuri TaxID=131310 RepID=A0A0N5A721_PARTI